MNLYDIVVNDAHHAPQKLSAYKDKVLLIVNTASRCGFTPQFEGLEQLYTQYGPEGLVILGFPCNQFAEQDPGSTEASVSFCQLHYGVTFPMMEKVEVNGKNAHPLYVYLKSQKKGIVGSAIKWNFTKFLIDRNGTVVKRYAPNVEPRELEKDIVKLLEAE